MNDLSLYKEVQNLWGSISISSTIIQQQQFELEIQGKLLSIFQVGDFYYFVFNLQEVRLEFVSPSIENVLQVSLATCTIENMIVHIHPDDRAGFLNFEYAVSAFFAKLPPEKIMKYKPRSDFRIRKADGSYIRVLQQTVIMDHDNEGRIYRKLIVHTDISHLKKDNTPVLSFIGLGGEPSYLHIEVEQKFIPSSFLSNREKQLILLLVAGKVTKEIACDLQLSVQTIETYRKKLLKKVCAKTTAELVVKAIKEGWV